MSSGTDKIVSNIISGAQIKADKIIQEAQVKAKSIEDDGAKKADLENKKILEDANKQAEMRYQQIISEAKMNSRRLELGAREEIIEESFKKAMDQLKEIANSSSKEYIDSLKKMIQEAAIEIGGGDLIIHLKQEDINKIKSSLDEVASNVKSEINVDTKFEFGQEINTIGGVVLKTKNGEIEVNNTIEARLSRYKKDLRSEVAKILFN